MGSRVLSCLEVMKGHESSPECVGQWASMPLCSALNAGGTPAPTVCCKSPGLEAPISPTTALGPKIKFRARTVPTSFRSWTLLRMRSQSLAPSPSGTRLLGRMRDKGQEMAASQPWWDTAKMPPNIALNLCGCRLGVQGEVLRKMLVGTALVFS